MNPQPLRQQGEIMKKRKDQIAAFLGPDTKFKGDISFEGLVRVDGRFKGGIKGEGTLIVGETALIDSDIHASKVIVSGQVRGRIVAEERIEILSPGRVFGDIEAPSVTIDTGVVFDGNCQTQSMDRAGNDKVAFLQTATESKNES
ncbi:MAG TPA: polymer-forming cytoskeletal protein [Deltaproteobacteria bacterium]|nr:polymer-forming cytoskeletal protein [Deltaproteobacteria bacterium]